MRVLALALALSSVATPAWAARPRCLMPERRLERPLIARGISFGPSDPRPPSVVQLASARGFPFWVHGPAGSTSYVTKLRDAADRAWQAEFVDRAWPAPPTDTDGPDGGYDLYVDADLDPDTAYTQPEVFVDTVRWDALTSYIGLPARFSDDETLASTVAHELNHASQFMLDAFEDDAFYEQTAVAVEAEVIRYVPGYDVGIDDYQASPERALDQIDGDLYEYGAALWLFFLTEHVADPAALLALWRASAQSTGDGTNEPDYLDALPAILGPRGWELRRFFATFTLWRYFTGDRDDGAHFRDGREWGNGSQVDVVDLVSEPSALRARLGAFGGASAELEVPGGVSAFSVGLEGDGAAAALAALGGDGRAIGGALFPTSSGDVVALPSGTARVVVALTRVPSAWDPDDDDWAVRQVGVTLARAAAPPDAGVEPVDAGVEPLDASVELTDAGEAIDGGEPPSAPDDEGSGCGCSSGRPADLAWALGALALAWARGGPRRRAR